MLETEIKNNTAALAALAAAVADLTAALREATPIRIKAQFWITYSRNIFILSGTAAPVPCVSGERKKASVRTLPCFTRTLL